MSVSKKRLWEAQLRAYPKSVRLTVHQMFEWCDAAPTLERKLSRYTQISMAMQYPSYVFYRIEGTPWMGFRMGVEGSQYMSLYQL